MRLCDLSGLGPLQWLCKKLMDLGLVGLFPACNRIGACKNRRKRGVRSRNKSELPAGGDTEETFALDTWLWKKS